jgi:hypothetical protein
VKKLRFFTAQAPRSLECIDEFSESFVCVNALVIIFTSSVVLTTPAGMLHGLFTIILSQLGALSGLVVTPLGMKCCGGVVLLGGHFVVFSRRGMGVGHDRHRP